MNKQIIEKNVGIEMDLIRKLYNHQAPRGRIYIEVEPNGNTSHREMGDCEVYSGKGNFVPVLVLSKNGNGYCDCPYCLEEDRVRNDESINEDQKLIDYDEIRFNRDCDPDDLEWWEDKKKEVVEIVMEWLVEE